MVVSFIVMESTEGGGADWGWDYESIFVHAEFKINELFKEVDRTS